VALGYGLCNSGLAGVRAECRRNGWAYDEMEGCLSLIQALVDGDWLEDDFVRLAPGEAVAADLAAGGETADCPIMKAVRATEVQKKV